jgi:DNA-binding protein H-NS
VVTLGTRGLKRFPQLLLLTVHNAASQQVAATILLQSFQYICYWRREYILSTGTVNMARSKNLENMSYAELAKMQADIERVKIEKQNSERASVKQKLIDMAKAAGFELQELFGGAGRGKRGKVAAKYRDPNDTANTWTGRGRMPRWMTAATKGGKAKKEDFLIS